MEQLSGQIALITGASSGIGEAIALKLAERGAILCLVARGLEALERAKSLLPAGTRAIMVQCDVTDDAALAALVAQVQGELGGVDLLVHSAAAYGQGPLETAPVADFDLQYRTNLRAPYVLTQQLLPILKRRRGQIVFINSSTGVNTRPFVTQYAATKHGLRGLADCLRQELADTGVRVISVYPGQTATAMQEKRYAIEKKVYAPEKLIQPSDVAEVVVGAMSLPRTAEVTDVHVRPAAR